MPNVKETTQEEIIEYIKRNSQDGKLTRSLIDIGKTLGYSNATIHRGLQALEKRGIIEVSTSEKRAEPSTIFYKGTKTDVDELLSQGVQLVREVQELSERLENFVKSTEGVMKGLQDQKRIQEAISNKSLTKDIQSLVRPEEDRQEG